MRTHLSAVVVAAAALSSAGCTQPPVACTVSTFTGYAAKFQLVEGTGSCAERAGDVIGMASYNSAERGAYDNTVPNLDDISLAIRTETLGAVVAHAFDEGVVDTTEGHAPHAFGPFDTTFPVDDVCRATLGDVRQTLPALDGDPGDPEDPDDDVSGQPAVDVGERWEDVQVLVTAANLGTQMKARYTVTDDEEGCSATYDVLAVFPAVFCEDIVAEGEPVDIARIDDDGDDGVVTIVTAAPHGLAEGDLVDIAGVDDDERSYDGTYSVAAVVDATTFVTGEIDPFDGDDPDPAGDAGTVQRLASVANDDYCSATALPERGIAVGSGISPDFPVVCDPELLLCVLDANPSDAAFPVLRE